MLADLRVDELAAMRLQAFVRAFLIRTHQPRVARHIGGEDRGKSPVREMRSNSLLPGIKR